MAVLDKADSLGDIKTISIPALCASYDSGFPFRTAADIMLTSCIEWL